MGKKIKKDNTYTKCPSSGPLFVFLSSLIHMLRTFRVLLLPISFLPVLFSLGMDECRFLHVN